MSKSVADILVEARKLIEKPENWTQGENARNDRGRHCMIDDPLAACWCMQGAIIKSAGPTEFTATRKAIDAFIGTIAEYITAYNDNPDRTHPEVLAAFDSAITRARASEPKS